MCFQVLKENSDCMSALLGAQTFQVNHQSVMFSLNVCLTHSHRRVKATHLRTGHRQQHVSGKVALGAGAGDRQLFGFLVNSQEGEPSLFACVLRRKGGKKRSN